MSSLDTTEAISAMRCTASAAQMQLTPMPSIATGIRARTMARLFTLAAYIAAAVAAAALTLPVASADAASDERWPAPTSSLEFNPQDGSLNIEWSGPIVPGMADYVRGAFDRYGARSRRVVLFLDSAGGKVEEGDRVICLLDEIKQTHRLITVVPDGKLCASMCVPIFLKGDDRLAGRASLWIFHEASKRGANRKERTEETLRLFDRYYVPAGVSTQWIKTIAPAIERAELRQSGADLVGAKAGIVTLPPEKWSERLVAPQRQKSI